ncbi:unnamed protein product [Tilletia controversa]|nr:unnamed protein product [Tilletia controversa]
MATKRAKSAKTNQAAATASSGARATKGATDVGASVVATAVQTEAGHAGVEGNADVPGAPSAEEEDLDVDETLVQEAQKPAKLAVTALVQYHKPRQAKTGAGAPVRKSKPHRRIVDVKPGDSFKVFQINVLQAIEDILKKEGCIINDLKYEALDLEAKVPKGGPEWKGRLPVDSATAYKDYKQHIFKASDRFSECSIELAESDSIIDQDSDDEFSDSDDTLDAARSSKKRKRKGTKSTLSKAEIEEKLKNDKIKTMVAINEQWKCGEEDCNLGGHCLQDVNGKHYPLTKTLKERFVRSVCEARVGTVEKPPEFLFDAPDKVRGRSGPHSGQGRTPQGKGKGKSTSDVTFLFSSPLSSTEFSPSRSLTRRLTARKPGSSSTASSTSNLLNRTLKLPLTHGALGVMLDDLAPRVRMHKATVDCLKQAGYMRLSQLARSYEHNFNALVQDATLTAAALSDLEDLLLYWGSRDGKEFAKENHNPFNFGPNEDEADLNDLSRNVKQEQDDLDLPFARPRTPVVVGREDAIVLEDSSAPASQAE